MPTPSRRADRNPARHLPLKPVWFHILTTLVGEPLHGYAIRQIVEARTEGQLRLWPATLYGSLGQMERSGLIEERIDPEPGDDLQRRSFALTTLGRRVLVAETERLEGLAKHARAAMRQRSSS